MKHRTLALLLVLTVLLAPAALASQALGWELYQTDTVLGDGLRVSSQVLWGDSKSDYRREQYAVYTPGRGVSPVVCYGASVPTTATLTSMAKGLEGYGYRVLAGANGDYFVMASGVPLGMVVSYGVLRSSSSYHYAVGFDADGRAFVGKPDVTLTASFHGYDLTLAGGYNKTRENRNGYFLYSADFGATTRASGSGVNVVLRPVSLPAGYAEPEKPGPAPTAPVPPEGLDVDAIWAALEGACDENGEPIPVSDEDLAALNAWEETRGQYQRELAAWEADMERWKSELAESAAGLASAPAQLRIGRQVECVVESVGEYSGAASIPEGRFVLSIGKSSDAFLLSEVAALCPGERLAVSVSAADARWERAYSAMGAYSYILQNGAVADALEQSADPRTALGIKADGTVILYTVDGRRAGYSVGASVQQVAKRLQELGCVEGVLFDGGGSTSFGTTGALDETFTLTNKPSEGSQRAVSNALFFVSELTPTGSLGSLYLQPQSALMLSGGRQSLSALGIDTGYYPLGGEPVEGLSYRVDGPGHMEGDVFVAGAEKGVATVTAKAPNGAEGTARMTVVATPDAITLTDAGGSKVTSLNLDPEQTVSLNAAATWYKLPLLADDSCFTWSLPEHLGSVDAYGNITAGPRAGSGALTVTAGEKSVSVPITVGGHVRTLEDFEGQLALTGTASAATTGEQVKLGRQSLAVTYPLYEISTLAWAQPIERGESYLGLWFLGDGSAPTLELHLALDDGQSASVEVVPAAQTGWQALRIPIPEDAVALEAMTVTPGEGAVAVAERAQGSVGRFYLDHLTSANGPIADATPPTLKLSVADGAVRATMSDNVDKTFPAERIALTLDGRSLEYTRSGNTLTASVPADGLLHRVSLCVTDASGNCKRVGAEVAPAPDRALPFGDIAGHWAQAHIVYLYDQGVTNGRAGDTGLVFDPDANITRGEFATMLARWLRADLTGYETAAVPFADAEAIPAWARGAVAYLYKAGVMAGSIEPEGLCAKANDPITRAQAMTMLGRIQAKGFEAQGDAFADDADIPTWAREHIYTLAGQGVVSGYNGLVRPNDHITRSEVAKLLTTMW